MSAIICQCVGDEADRPLTLKPLPTGQFQICCDECGEAVVDNEPQTWRELASAAIADLFRYADDELPHRRMVSANAYLARFKLLETASATLTREGGDAQQAPFMSGAVAKPDAQVIDSPSESSQ